MDHYTPTAADLERFWSRVDRPSAIRQPHDPASEPAELAEGCWPWTAGTNSRGYGRIRWNGQAESANRIVWLLIYGPIPNQQRVLPTCYNPRCCNPAHLTLASRHVKIQRRACRWVQPHRQALGSNPALVELVETQGKPQTRQRPNYRLASPNAKSAWACHITIAPRNRPATRRNPAAQGAPIMTNLTGFLAKPQKPHAPSITPTALRS